MREQNIEKLFKDTFSNFEADVNPSVWANVEQSLPATPQNVPGSSPVKPSGFFRKISLSTFVIVAAISATLIGTAIYITSQKPVTKNVLTQNITAEPQSVKNNTTTAPFAPPAAVKNIPVTEPKNTDAKTTDTKSKAKEKDYLNEPPRQTSAPVKTEANPVSTSAPVPVSAEKGVTQEPAPAELQNSAVSNHKISTTLTQTNQSTGQKFAGGHSTADNEVSPVTAGPLNSSAPVQEVSQSEYNNSQEFHFFIPNVFTPNDDMVNDYFQPVASNGVKDFELTIYDRYGFEIFRSRDIAFPWDGKLRDGNMAASAVYVYIIKLTDFKDEEHDYMGHVALLR